MFGWLKNILTAGKQKAHHVPPPVDYVPSGTIKPLSVMQVVDNFLTQNPAPTPFGVHALIAAGATELLSGEELVEACEKIQEHGYQYPINPTLQHDLNHAEILRFLRWQSKTHVELDAYQDENTIRDLISRFRYEA